jgi:GTP cyclohydrolase I
MELPARCRFLKGQQMNAPEHFFASEPRALPDIQSAGDRRNLPIQRVGVKGVRHPVLIRTVDGGTQPSVATFDMFVALPSDVKGTHMSRFVEILEAHAGVPLDPATLRGMFDRMLERLGAQRGEIALTFTYFMRKTAPVSGVSSLMDYEASFHVTGCVGAPAQVHMTLQVPVTSLCPCSREISNYGAHNQRSHLTLKIETKAPMHLDDIVRVAESSASCELWGLLKRPDEKYVTERAYDNPKFVEDLVRDVALALRSDARVDAFTVESENFESIHNHSAYARIDFVRGA